MASVRICCNVAVTLALPSLRKLFAKLDSVQCVREFDKATAFDDILTCQDLIFLETARRCIGRGAMALDRCAPVRSADHADARLDPLGMCDSGTELSGTHA